MAYHHHHPHMPPTTANTTATTCYCCCYTSAHNPSLPQPQPPQPDPLVQAIASQLTNLHNTPRNLHSTQNHQSLHHQAIFSSIVSRIDALELSLHHNRSSLCSSYSRRSSSTLRDLAARVIQTHFRAFLVRRSRALRQLKELAFIKSSYNALKSKVSCQTHLDLEAVYQKAMHLLFKLDCIQGDDPMVRDGKRSISRDLARFLDYIDEVAVRRCEESVVVFENKTRFGDSRTKSGFVRSRRGDVGGIQMSKMKVLKDRVERMRKLSKSFRDDERLGNVGLFGGGDDDEEEDDKEDEEDEPVVVHRGKNGVSRVPVESMEIRRGVQSRRPKKSVSFSDVHRVYNDNEELISNEDDNCTDGSGSIDGNAEVEKLRNEVEKMSNLLKSVENKEASMENGGSSCTEINSRMNPVNSGGKQNGINDGKLLVSAPLPLKMDSRADL